MKLEEAKVKLKELVKGEYHAVSCRLTEVVNGEKEMECQLYVNPGILISGPTFEWCFAELKIQQENTNEL